MTVDVYVIIIVTTLLLMVIVLQHQRDLTNTADAIIRCHLDPSNVHRQPRGCEAPPV